MARKLFGTDGIRGVANQYPMTCEVAMALGRAVVQFFEKNSKSKSQPLIIVGKDTRRSCYMLEQAFSAGVCSQGGRVILTGPLPTPGIAFVTKSMRADAGVMISASHNPYSDNGIKIFDRAGYKLPDVSEEKLESLVLNPSLIELKKNEELGNAKRLDEVLGRYIVNTKSALDSSIDLEGLKVVLDCANGAGYKAGPFILTELGIDLTTIGVEPNGVNINHEVGSLYPQKAAAKLKEIGADVALTLDGDADRLIVVDEKGSVVEGDQLIGLLAKRLLETGEMKKGDTVVGTVMTNLGLENYLKKLGLNFIRTKVGDRYIIEKMREGSHILGGEPSGHIILKNHSTTGDGILAGLKILETIKAYDKKLSELVSDISLIPQELKNLKVSAKPALEENKNIQDCLSMVNAYLGDEGRVLLRYSGTENVIRIMVEANTTELMNKAMKDLEIVVKQELCS